MPIAIVETGGFSMCKQLRFGAGAGPSVGDWLGLPPVDLIVAMSGFSKGFLVKS